MKYRVYKSPRFDRPWRVRHPDGHVFGFPTFEDALVGMRWHQERFYPAVDLIEAHLAEGISADLKGLVVEFAKTKGSYQLGLELAEHLGLGEPGSQYPDPVLSPQMKALDDTLPCLRHDVHVVHGQMVCRRCHQVRNRATQKWPHPQGPPFSLD